MDHHCPTVEVTVGYPAVSFSSAPPVVHYNGLSASFRLRCSDPQPQEPASGQLTLTLQWLGPADDRLKYATEAEKFGESRPQAIHVDGYPGPADFL